MKELHKHFILPPPQIYFWEFQLQNETERLRTLFLPELGVKLKNLTGYTTYMISVAAFNAAGDGPRSLPTRGRTQQAGESNQLDPDVAAESYFEAVRRSLPDLTAGFQAVCQDSNPGWFHTFHLKKIKENE